jgi:pyruvate dehydrogenase E1 component
MADTAGERGTSRAAATADDLATLGEIEKKVLWLSQWMIHAANHLREPGEIKVGGHQASSASMVQILTALYFRILRPADRVAVKPHASPVFHAIQYLAGREDVSRLKAFRGWGGAQSYPSRTKDGPIVDFSTGSVGLGVALTAFASLVQDYVSAKGWSADRPEGRMIALVGDAELDEGNVYECLQEGWKHGLRNTWWVIDYNRQSLDGVVREGLYDRIERVFRAFGWEIVTVKYGAAQRAAFAEPGGDRLRDWIDACPNPLYSALAFQGGQAWRRRLLDDIGDQGPVTALLERRSDDELAALMLNLGGHCLPSLVEAFEAVDHDRPVVFIAYTIKGWGTPLAGHKDNHAGLMTPAQMEAFRAGMGVALGAEWDLAAGLRISAEAVRRFVAATPYFAPRPAPARPAPVAVPAMALAERTVSTQAAFGKLLDALARDDSELARRIMTTSPDVTVSTNLGPFVNRRGLFAREAIADHFRVERVPSAQKWQFSPEGQHVELGIAEMNLFLLLAAAGLSTDLFGEPLFPVGTLYDPFIARGLDALNYACYQDARFLVVATPSGVTLAPEGGAHQSIGTPLIGMSQDGLAAFEPAFADELAVVMRWAFAHMQRRGDKALDPRTSLADGLGGATYLRLTTRPLEQPIRAMDDRLASGVIDGGYWLREPGPSAEIVVAYQGAVAPEAIASAALIAEGRRDVGVLALTSADRLHQGWIAARRARSEGRAAASAVETLLAAVPRHAGIVTVIDGHPATLGWLGGVHGHKVAALGVDRFGQTGTIADLYRAYGIDAEGIARAADGLVPARRLRLAVP